ncbi:hypothetical protein GCM10007939_04700 [Amylibacter marinus]|uniref:Uncharacterized protein n=1 Tax=Amylibacter marinus TaxID=1475483 RepID=A0ABQ5VSR6_9RHOB|nr:hypothetical protein GCM10007939_04700 [Amylibacter marinus]
MAGMIMIPIVMFVAYMGENVMGDANTKSGTSKNGVKSAVSAAGNAANWN